MPSRQSRRHYGVVSILGTCLKLWNCVAGLGVRGIAALWSVPCEQLGGARSKPEGILTTAMTRMMAATQMMATTQMMTMRRRSILNCYVSVLVLALVLLLVQVQVQVLVELQFEQTPPERRQSQLPKCPMIEPLPSDRFRRQLQATVCGFCMHITGLSMSMTPPLYLGLGKQSQGYRYSLLRHS
jgi:hypothetical protein